MFARLHVHMCEYLQLLMTGHWEKYSGVSWLLLIRSSQHLNLSDLLSPTALFLHGQCFSSQLLFFKKMFSNCSAGISWRSVGLNSLPAPLFWHRNWTCSRGAPMGVLEVAVIGRVVPSRSGEVGNHGWLQSWSWKRALVGEHEYPEVSPSVYPLVGGQIPKVFWG